MLCAAIVIVAKVRVSESDGCACAVLLMCALAAGDERGAPASSEAQAAIARVSIPFALVNGLFLLDGTSQMVWRYSRGAGVHALAR